MSSKSNFQKNRFPERFFEPLKVRDREIRLMNYSRTRELTRDDVEKMFNDYYEERGWDIEGDPSPPRITTGKGHGRGNKLEPQSDWSGKLRLRDPER